MSAADLTAAEDSVAKMIGSSFTAGTATAAVPVSEPGVEVLPFEFEPEFQTRIAALAIRDVDFLNHVGHLLKPQFFENAGEASIVNLALEFHSIYGEVPKRPVLIELIREAKTKGTIRKDVLPDSVKFLQVLPTIDVSNREYIETKVADFARHQAVSQAILSSVDLLGRGKFEKIEADIRAAIEIGVNEDGDSYDYYERVKERSATRIDLASGAMVPRGITTGVAKLDGVLFHRGWGRKELTTIMGGAKAGKTTALISFAKAASLAGYNVLYATLEVSKLIISDRLDASVTDTLMKELTTNIKAIEEIVTKLQEKAGRLILHEYPSGTLSPNMLRQLIDRYKAKGVKFDLIVVDYADIMAPNHRYDNVIENSKSVYVDLRAIAQQEDAAVLTATQTNREGYKSTVAKAEHVAEDFNKVRTVDLMISINITDEERTRNEARLYFAASRNQESGFTIFIKQDMARMKFIESVLRVE